MIAHATHHAERPLPSCGVTLKALFFPKLHEVRHAQEVCPMGKHFDGRMKESGEMIGPVIYREKPLIARIKLYRPMMIGRGWITVDVLHQQSGLNVNSIRQRLNALADTGHVEKKIRSPGAVKYKWIGA